MSTYVWSIFRKTTLHRSQFAGWKNENMDTESGGISKYFSPIHVLGVAETQPSAAQQPCCPWARSSGCKSHWVHSWNRTSPSIGHTWEGPGEVLWVDDNWMRPEWEDELSMKVSWVWGSQRSSWFQWPQAEVSLGCSPQKNDRVFCYLVRDKGSVWTQHWSERQAPDPDRPHGLRGGTWILFWM